MKYPKFNKKQLTKEQKEMFDYWKENFYLCITNSDPVKVSKEDAKVLAWNCAFLVVTDKK